MRHEADRQQREIREMLVIDGVELVLLDQVGEMRKLQRNDAFGLQQQLQATNKVIEIRHLRQNIVTDQEVGLASCTDQFGGKRRAEEIHARRHALGDCRFGHIGRRFDAKDRNALRQKMLQQIAVIAGDLDHEAVFIQPQPLCDFVAIGLRMADPAGGEG